MPSIPQLLIVLAIVVLLFGARKLRNLGGDLGAAVRGFKSGMKGEGEQSHQDAAEAADDTSAQERVIEGEPSVETASNETDREKA